MVLLQEVSKPGSDIEEYVSSLDAMLAHKLEIISMLRSRLLGFYFHLRQEEELSKKFYTQQQVLLNPQKEQEQFQQPGEGGQISGGLVSKMNLGGGIGRGMGMGVKDKPELGRLNQANLSKMNEFKQTSHEFVMKEYSFNNKRGINPTVEGLGQFDNLESVEQLAQMRQQIANMSLNSGGIQQQKGTQPTQAQNKQSHSHNKSNNFNIKNHKP
jgi:hypothetical protein